MRVTSRENDGVPRRQTDRRFITNLNVTIAFRNQMEDHYTLGIRLEQRSGRVSAGGLVAPGRGKPRIDEDGPYQAHHPKSFR